MRFLDLAAVSAFALMLHAAYGDARPIDFAMPVFLLAFGLRFTLSDLAEEVRSRS